MKVKILVSRGWLSWGLPLIYVLLLAWFLIGDLWTQQGLPNSADGILHLHRSAAMARSWASGVVWPRWFPDVYQGLGSPVFHFYSPLFYLLVAPLHLLGLSLDLSAKIVISAFYVASGLASWAWLRRLLTREAGLAGAALYLSQPHLFREVYFQGDYPQLLALLWLPVVLWAFTRLYLDGGWRNWLIAPLALALLVATHNITAMLGAGVLVLYWLTLPLWRSLRGRWRRGPVAALLGVGVSAFFWLPALADTGWVRIGNLQTGFFHYSQYFVRWQDLFAAPPVLDLRASNPPFPYMLGWAAWLAVAGAGIVVLVGLMGRTGWTASRIGAAIGVAFVALCLALTQHWSTPIWEVLPGLALVEFPWRWLAIAALGVALAGGATVASVGPRRSWLFLSGLVVAVGLGSSVFVVPDRLFLRIADYSAVDTQSYEIHTHVWGTTSGNEFLPRWADSPQPEAGELARVEFLPAGSEWSWETPHRAVLEATADLTLPAGPLILPVHYFPAWQGTVDGEPVLVEAGIGGLTALEVPHSAQQIVLQWRGTPWQKRGELASLLALVAWGLWLGWIARRGVQKTSPSVITTRLGYRQLAPLGCVLLLILACEALHISNLSWFQRSSPPDTVSHAEYPLHMELGGDGQPSITLLGWDLLSGLPRPGSEVRLRLYWQPQKDVSEDLHSFLHLYEPALQRSWAVVQNHNPGGIPTSRWIQPLYYVDDLTLQLPLDLPPATFTLVAGMVNEEGQRLAVQDNQRAEDLVYLDEIQVSPLRAGWRQPLRPDTATPAEFGQSLHLQGYDFSVNSGQPILRLYWEVLETPSEDLVTFVHLLDEEGQIVAQFDGPPLEGLLPTSQWPEGALVVDRRTLEVSDDLMRGSNYLLVGLYDRATVRRVPVQPDARAVEHFNAGDGLIVPFDVLPGAGSGE